MVRETFETASDLKNEDDVKVFIESKWPVTLHKLPRSYELDFAIANEDKSIRAFAEVKCRKCKMLQYETFFISLRKFKAGMSYARNLLQLRGNKRVSFLIFVQWLDALAMYKWNETHELEIDFSGRTRQQRDSADIEPMIHVPTKYFEVIK